jgi:tetratricopeptide (TPR) repeat protein
LRAVELELAGKSGAAEASLPKFAAILADTNAVLSEAERTRLADLLVLAFQPLPSAGSGQEQIAAEVRAVHDALVASCQGQWESAAAMFREVARRSAFSHWVMFLKGLAAFHHGETDRMEKCFDALPTDSVPAKAAQAYRLLTGQRSASQDGRLVSEVLIEAAGKLAGTPGAGGLLLRAEKAWKEGRHAESYRVFRDTLRSFPSHGADWLSALSEFYFHAPHGMSEAERSGYVRFFDGLISRRQFKSGTEEMWMRRMFTLLDSAIMPAWNLRHDWECFLRQHQALHGENPRLASLAYGWLGEQLSMTRVSPGLFAPRQPQLRDAPGAVEVLLKSIQLDPNNLAAHLQLCAVYDALKQTSERNRLLDEMTARFPDDKDVLLRAAQGCVDRKAFVKGLDYLDRVRQIDPLDPRIPELVVTAQRRLARQYFQQAKPEKGRQTLARTHEALNDQPDDLQRSRWTALVRHSLMELLWGEAAQGDALLAQARSLAPAADACLLFTHMAHRVYTNTRRCQSPFWTEFNISRGLRPASAALRG